MPVYSFENGLNYDDSLYTNKTHESTPGLISFESIQAINERARPDNSDFDVLTKEIEDVHTASYDHYDKRGNVQRGQFEYSLFNQTAESETLKLIILGWGSNYLLPGTARGIAALALADSDQRFAVCNFMGRGRSTPLPLSRSLAIARTGSFIPAGELLHAALEQEGIMQDSSGIDMLGESEGHRLALGAIASGLTVERGTFVDGPGMDHFGFIRLAHRLQIKEGRHNREYVARSSDAWLQTVDNDSRIFRQVLRHVKQGVALSQYVFHPMGLSKAGLEFDTRQALPRISQEFAVVSHELSEITDHYKTERMMGSIAAENASGCPPVLRHRVGRGLTHSVAVAGPGARSQLLTL